MAWRRRVARLFSSQKPSTENGTLRFVVLRLAWSQSIPILPAELPPALATHATTSIGTATRYCPSPVLSFWDKHTEPHAVRYGAISHGVISSDQQDIGLQAQKQNEAISCCGSDVSVDAPQLDLHKPDLLVSPCGARVLICYTQRTRQARVSIVSCHARTLEVAHRGPIRDRAALMPRVLRGV